MRQHKMKSSKRFFLRPLPLAILLVVLIGGGAAYAWYRHDQNQKDKAAKTSVEKRPVNSIDYGPADPSDNGITEDHKNNPDKSPSTNDGTGAASFSALITRVTVKDAEQTVQVGTLVEGTTNGTCTVSFSQSGQPPVTRSAAVELEVNSYTCGVLSVPFSSFPKGGEWKAALSVESGGKKATSQWSQTVNISKE